MAPLSLKCPLCCNETFSSYSSLKYHLLSIVDNLFCPACDSRFEDILTLAEHLARECKEDVARPVSKKIKIEEQSSPPASPNSESEPNFEQVFINPKSEREDEIENNSSDKVLHGKSYLQLHDQPETEGSQDENGTHLLYTCQMCNISFNSIQEHLQKYHEGEEVVLETENDEEDVAVVEDEHDSALLSHEDDEFDESESRSNLQTLDEQQCLDKDGRVYTRKVVKIDKFWMNNKSRKIAPMTEKYLLENGKIKKISSEEAKAVSDPSQIIEIHQCPKCFLQFPNISHYKNHKCDPSASSDKMKYKCTYCTSVYLNFNSLNEHMKSHYIKDDIDKDGKIQRTVTIGPHVCEICNTMFPSFKSLRLHKRMHEPVKSKEVEAPVHYSIMGPKEEEPIATVRQMFLCCVCNKTYDKEYEEIHMKSHSGVEDFVCSVCNRKFYTKENLEMHMKAHSNGKKFACSYCKKPFTTYDALQDHVTNQCQKRQYECQYCGRRFARPHEKVKHERIHTGEKPHVCQICGKAFRVSYCLTLHMRTHSGTRPYECSHCGKRFKSHSVYNHHLLTHSDIRNYKCPFCPKAFKTGVQLAGHKNSHTKPFSCTECNRPFASLYAVRAHMETHKRENNLKYDCWLCGATYARSFALKDHMKSTHAGYSITGTRIDDNILIELEETTASANQIENEMEQQDENAMEDEGLEEYVEPENEATETEVHAETVEAVA